MKLEKILELGAPMVPGTREDIVYYDGPLIGTFKVGGDTILFWTPDASDEPKMRYVYALLTDPEAEKVRSYFQPVGEGGEACKNHPLLTNRRIVVGMSDKSWKLTQVVILGRSTEDVFAEVDQLFPI